MPDNVGYTPGSGATIAADDISGVLYQRVKVGVGADGTAVDVSSANPMPIGNIDPSATTAFGPITTANTALFSAIDTANAQSIQLQVSGNFAGGVYLQASDDGTTYFTIQGTALNSDVQTVDTLSGPDTITIPVVARYFRAVTAPNFSGSVSGVYALRWAESTMPFVQNTLMQVDPSVSMPVAGMTPSGMMRRILVADNGGVVPADGVVVQGTRNGASVGPVVVVDTTGYGSILLQLQGTFTGTLTFQVSNDATSWQSAVAWAVAGAATPVSTATAVGQWVIPAAGRFFRVQVTTAGTGNPIAIVALKNWSAWMPLSSPSTNIASIGGVAVSAATAQLGMNVVQYGGTAVVTGGVAGIPAVGGNIAVGTAPTANPIPLAWDGTNTRRILTDASSGGIVLGSSTVTNGQTLARFNQTVVTPAATQIKASAGRLTQLTVSNGAAVAGFLHLYNAAAVTLGTTNDVHCYAIPANVANFDIALPDGGLYFSTGIGGAFTAGSGANDNTAFGSAPTLICNYAFI